MSCMASRDRMVCMKVSLAYFTCPGSSTNLTQQEFKGTVSRNFFMQFYSLKHVSRPPDSYPKAVSNINLNSPRYSNSNLIPRCGPPPLEDSILRCGPSRRIKTYDVAPLRGIESYGVGPPAGSNPTVWPTPTGSNPMVWPLPQDRLSWD